MRLEQVPPFIEKQLGKLNRLDEEIRQLVLDDAIFSESMRAIKSSRCISPGNWVYRAMVRWYGSHDEKAALAARGRVGEQPSIILPSVWSSLHEAASLR